jgi:hypothetical protein
VSIIGLKEQSSRSNASVAPRRLVLVATECDPARQPNVASLRNADCGTRPSRTFAIGLTYGGQMLIFIAIVLPMVVHAMMYGPQAALIGERFPHTCHYGGADLGYQLA